MTDITVPQFVVRSVTLGFVAAAAIAFDVPAAAQATVALPGTRANSLVDRINAAQARHNAAAQKCNHSRMQAATQELEKLVEETRLAFDQAKSTGAGAETFRQAENVWVLARAALHFHQDPPPKCR